MRSSVETRLGKAGLAAALLAVLTLSSVGRDSPSTPEEPIDTVHRIYSHLVNPLEHPDYFRRAVKPPTWATFKDRTQFTCLRGFNVSEDHITGYAEELEKYTRTFGLGNVIWPSYPILFATNLFELADEIKRRDLYLFDIWGYVPGSGPGGYWQQFKVPPGALEMLESKLGGQWLGTDIGEQDGRYVGGYAAQMTPASANHFEQYLNFQRHFERMGDDLGHKHAALVSLNFGHYFLKEGTYTMLGAETAQALPNNQVYYAFIRGAGKQYGVPWFGNASIFNRWGFKTYGSSGRSDGYEHGPTKGTSLSLLKRLLYYHICYNCVAVGFENGWFDGEQLSPIGRIQQAAQRWILDNGQPGVMHTPVALLLDFQSGWTFPRHLYSENLYRVWGNLPYEQGDFFTDAVLELLYPGYQNSSYYHDESGFIAPTPYGDIADCLLSDAPGWLLARYPVVIVAGGLARSRELRDKLQAYIETGGHLVITAGNLAQLPGGLAGLTAAPSDLTTNFGKGKLTLFASPFGIESQGEHEPKIRSEIDRPLPKPCTLRPEVRRGLEQILRNQVLLEPGNRDLSYVTCRRGPGEYRILVANNTWHPQTLSLTSLCGSIESLKEVRIDDTEKAATGYVPEGVDGSSLGTGSETVIAGGDLRVFAVRVKETGVTEIPHAKPPAHPKNRALPLRHLSSVKEEILARPTFFEHYDGVVVDWRYPRERETSALQQEAEWIRRQGLKIYVDLSSGIDLYPTLRLIDNLTSDYAASMEAVTNVMDKMELLGARDLILTLHRHPENNLTGQQTEAKFEQTLRTLAGQAAGRKIILHLRMAFAKPPGNVPAAVRMLDRIGAANLRLACSTALLDDPGKADELLAQLRGKLGLWLVAARRTDLAGKTWDVHGPLYQSRGAAQNAGHWLKLFPEIPTALDGIYNGPDEEYLEAKELEQVLKAL